jgi:hypothetical protein
MPATQSVLNYDVFTPPGKPFLAPPPTAGDAPAWDPTTSTLIFGARDAVLVDPLRTVPEATALADWVGLHDHNLTTIYTRHVRRGTLALATQPAHRAIPRRLPERRQRPMHSALGPATPGTPDTPHHSLTWC